MDLLDTVECTLDHPHDIGLCDKSTGGKQRPSCSTDFVIDFQSRGRSGIDYLVTKWKDLGEGRTDLYIKYRTDHKTGRSLQCVIISEERELDNT